ncbi:Cell morphogenesis protein PAG1, partial [Kappamyces sp. JEL0680]
MLLRLADTLSTCVSDSHKQIQYHSLDLLLSLHHIVKSISSREIVYSYPQLFWISLALLSSVNEWEYREGAEILELVLTNQSVINSLMSTLPSKWPGGFSGLFAPLSRGLQSSKIEEISLRIINSLLVTAVPVFLDTRPSKYLFVLLANLPKIVQA